MNAITLPVSSYRQGADYQHLWGVRDGDGARLVSGATESQASQIALALNVHDDLVEALNELMAAAIHCDPDFEHRWSVASIKVRAVLARAETANETK